jgi:predicted HTH transcriptional regulator
MTTEQRETLEFINAHKNTTASIVAANLGIEFDAAVGRLMNLVINGWARLLIKSGRETRYSITGAGETELQ